MQGEGVADGGGAAGKRGVSTAIDAGGSLHLLLEQVSGWRQRRCKTRRRLWQLLGLMAGLLLCLMHTLVKLRVDSAYTCRALTAEVMSQLARGTGSVGDSVGEG